MRINLLNKYIVFCFICLLGNYYASAQDFSNKGKDFWVGYGTHVSMYANTGIPIATGGPQDLVLYFTSDHDATVKVEIPSVGYTRTYKVLANSKIR